MYPAKFVIVNNPVWPANVAFPVLVSTTISTSTPGARWLDFLLRRAEKHAGQRVRISGYRLVGLLNVIGDER